MSPRKGAFLIKTAAHSSGCQIVPVHVVIRTGIFAVHHRITIAVSTEFKGHGLWAVTCGTTERIVVFATDQQQ